MRLALLILAASFASAQPSAPGGLVYQALLQNGVSYISPSAGQAILSQKAGLNWKTLGSQILVDGSLGVLSGGLAGVINIGTTAETGLAAFHLFADKKIAPILALAGSHPDSIPPVLQVGQSMAPTVTGCAENSIYAVFNPKAPPRIPAAIINGLVVSFSAQGAAVLRNAGGQLIRSFQIIDVLACLPDVAPVPVLAPPSLQQPTPGAVIDHGTAGAILKGSLSGHDVIGETYPISAEPSSGNIKTPEEKRQSLAEAPGLIPRLWNVDTERPEETGLAAMKGNAGQWHNGVEVASR